MSEERHEEVRTPEAPPPGASANPPTGIVAVGASAGGLNAFERFLRAIEPGGGLAYVVIQHLSPEHESILPQLLGSYCRLPVETARDGVVPEADRIYVIPPNATLLYVDGRLALHPLEPRATRHPISDFFGSLALGLGPRAVAVILSGTGSDGASGLRALKIAGGLTLVQTPAEAEYDAMPRNALATGDVDFVVAAADMPRVIATELRRRSEGLPAPAPPKLPDDDPLDAIARIASARCGHDIGAYKRSTLVRRIRRRMGALRLERVEQYASYVEAHAAESDALVAELMIGVTQFFRDPEAFQALVAAVLPELARVASERPVRVWVPGCATGEEAYSLAILVRDEARRRKVSLPVVQVFATDIDEEALSVARRGRYPAEVAADVPAELLERWFTKAELGYEIAKEIRDTCIFSAHDVLRDPPFSRLDLISCRNLLIYFDSAAQRRVVPLLHYALRPGGYLFLGGADTVDDHPDLLEPIDRPHRIFQRKELDRAPSLPVSIATTVPRRPMSLRARPEPRTDAPLVQAALLGMLGVRDGAALALVDRQGDARYFAGPISRYVPTPTGVPTANLIDLAPAPLRAEIGASLQLAAGRGVEVRREVPVPAGELTRRVEILVKPADGTDFHVVVFRDLPRAEAAGDARARDGRNAALDEEVSAAAERWRSSGLEQDSASEQLRSANEELQTMNEELQSSNQELQVSQEELQSLNEELHTVNAELSQRVEELNALYSDLKNLFQSTQIATVFLDRELRIARFTPAAAQLFPLSQRDVGRPLADLKSPFENGIVAAAARGALEQQRAEEHVASLHDGSASFLVRALPYQRLDGVLDGAVLTFIDVTELKRAEAALREAEERERRRAGELDAIMRSVPAAVWIARDVAARDVVGNPTSDRILRVPPGTNASISSLLAQQPPPIQILHEGRRLEPHELPLERAAARGEEVTEFEEQIEFRDGSHVHLFGHAVPLRNASGEPSGAVGAFLDITRVKDAEEAVRRSERRFRDSIESLRDGFGVFRPRIGDDGAPVDFDVEYLNEPARRIVCDANEPATGSLLERCPLPGGAALLAVLVDATRSEEMVQRHHVLGGGVVRAGLPDDRIFDVRACRLQDGSVVVGWRDDTERSKAVAALHDADRRKDEFLAVLGHELRNPLAALHNALQLAHGASPGGPVERHHAIMRRQVGVLRRLVDDLLDVTRITRGKIRLQLGAVDLRDVVRAEFDLHAGVAGERLRMHLVVPQESVWIRGDGERVGQIVGNLLGNACKFTEPGGDVEVSIEAGEGRPTLRVRDTGIGMDAATLAKIFVPFQQAEKTLARSRGGLGLGLALVKNLANLMGAEVEARSDGLGAGSEFVVRFVAASGVPRAEERRAPEPISSRKLHVLVVEDNADVASSLAEYISSSLGHEVSVAADGASGVAAARRLRPDVILCDIGLPVIDGYEVARALRADGALRDIPLVALTGYGRNEDRDRARDAGFDRHFTKPLDIADIRRLLDELATGDRSEERGDQP